MSNNTILPPLVVVAEGPCQLMGRHNGNYPSGAPRHHWEAFEKTLSWRLSAEASLVLRHKGIEIKHCCGFHDCSRHFLACVFFAYEAIKEIARSYAISPGEAFTLEVDVAYELIPFVKEKDADQWEVVGAGRYWHETTPEFLAALEAAEEVTPEMAYDLYQSHDLEEKLIEPRPLALHKAVWSSGKITSLDANRPLAEWVDSERQRIDHIAQAPGQSLTAVMDDLIDASAR